MADNIAVTPGTGAIMVANEVTWSSDTAKLQGVEIFVVTGAEGSRVGTQVSDAAPLPVQQAAQSRTVDAISTAIQGDVIMQGLVALTPKFAAIAAATSGANTLVAAVTAKKIRVLALFILAGAAGNIYLTSAAAGAVIFGGSTNKINLAANGGFTLPFSPVGWCETVAGELLNLNASSTGPFSGVVVYVEV